MKNKKMDIVNIIFMYIILIISFILIIKSGIKKNYPLMSVMVIPFLVSLVFIKLGSFSEFEISSKKFKAKIQEADNLIEELKRLAITLSKPISSSLLISSLSFVNTPYRIQREYLRKIEEALSELGLQRDDIIEAVKPYHDEIKFLYKNNIITTIHNRLGIHVPNETKTYLLKYLKVRDSNPDKLRDYIAQKEIELEESEKDLLYDLEYYIKNNEHRRPEDWP